MNGIFAKIGNWYEEGYVVLQYLRMLAGRADAVTWEARDEDGKGIDLRIVERGLHVAIQCKTKSTGPWTKSTLKKPLMWARYQLTRKDPGKADQYWFVTDASLPNGWKGFTDSDLAEQLDARVTDEKSVEERIFDIASLVAAEDLRVLIYELGRFARTSLTNTISPKTLHDYLFKAKVPLRESLDRDSFASKLRILKERFVDRLAQERKHLGEQIEREEVKAVIQALRDRRRGRQILVHAEGGAGKSQILGMVAEALEREGVAVLVVRADETEVLAGTQDLPEDPVLNLRQFVGDADHGAVLIIDQIDQIAHAGAAAQTSLARVTKWIREAKGRIDVVLGCRTLDALHSTQIGTLLDADTEKISVQPLPEKVPQQRLEALGIPFFDLSLEVRDLSRNPAVLECLLRLGSHQPQGHWRQARSSFEIIDGWWKIVEAPFGEGARSMLDRLVDRMERDGTLDVDRELVTGVERTICDKLRSEGVLVEKNGRIRFTHQLHFDVLLARRWANYTSFEQLLDALSDKSKQDLHKARQLRLTTPLFRGTRGAAILEKLLASEDVRPLLKRSAQIGLAELKAIDPEILKVVERRLDDSTLTIDVLSTTILGSQVWFDALERSGWFARAWGSALSDPERQDAVLRVLGAVVSQRGNEVARHVREWSQSDPKVLERARFMFWQDPSQDSDDLFDLRIDLPDDTTTHRIGVWDRLVRMNPQRAVRLLARRMSFARQDLLLQRQLHVDGGWPRANQLPKAVFDLGSSLFEQLESWWRAFVLEDLRSIDGDGDEAEIVRIVQTLARCLAVSIRRGELDWDRLRARLPNPLRNLDRWLLLEVGSQLTEIDSKLADAAMDWFISDSGAATIETGFGPWVDSEFPLAAAFLKTLSGQVSDAVFLRLEEFLVRHQSGWSVDAERWRAREFQFNMSGRFGYVAYRLLPCLPESRTTPLIRGRLASLREKFDAVFASRRTRHGFTSGWPQSPIPSSKAMQWTLEEWKDHFQDAPLRGSPKTTSRGRVAHDQQTLAGLFGVVARARPEHGYAIARGLCDPESRLLLPIRLEIAEQVASIRVRTSEDEPERFAIEAHRLEELLRHFLGKWQGEVTATIQSIVEARAQEVWADAIYDDLEARVHHGFERSLIVLGALAFHHKERRGSVLKLAEQIAIDARPEFRDAAIRAAMACFDTSPDEATRVTLSAIEFDPRQTKDHHNRAHVLWFLVQQPLDDSDRTRAIAAFEKFLIGLDSSHSRFAMQYFMQLVCGELIDDECAHRVLDYAENHRIGAADVVKFALDEAVPSRLVLKWAITFANDESARVREVLFSTFSRSGGSARLDDESFRNAMLCSRGMKDDACRRNFIEGLDRGARLLPVADLILKIACGLAHSRPPSAKEDSWKRDAAQQAITARLLRLIEECEREEEWALRNQCLDAVDALVVAKLPQVNQEILSRTQ